MTEMNFEFSDLISGYVSTALDGSGSFTMKTSDGRAFAVKKGSNIFARITRNLGEDYIGCSEEEMDALLIPGQMVFAYGIFYPEAGGHVFEAQVLDFPGREPAAYRFEAAGWWQQQATQIADFFINAQFGGPDGIDYEKYRTELKITGTQTGDTRQETDTISRLVYGFASTYMLTGEERFLIAAEKGTKYLQEVMKLDLDEETAYWLHGVEKRADGSVQKLLGSKFGDDWNAIPLYEQIYALAGLTQTYRITGEKSIMRDIDKTIKFMDDYFKDEKGGGYFSHVDPCSFDPRDENLGHNRGRKNWNSIGDHAPAYLINLWLAKGDEKHKAFLEDTFDTIVEHMSDYENSPFVNEKFFEDWSEDHEWQWQQNQAVVGHNLKIAWNLTRMNNLVSKAEYQAMAQRIAGLMPEDGMDKQRFGWYDVVARIKQGREEMYRFSWHDRKAWWQQEQGILAYQILYGAYKDEKYRDYARESAAFYNNFFLDYQDGAVYFNVLANGTPYLLGTERQKGSHSMSGYHSMELTFLSAIYTQLLNTKEPLDLFFKPEVDSLENNILRVEPDTLPPNSAQIESVWVDDVPWHDFDADGFTVQLPKLDYRAQIKVRLVAK